MTPVQISEKIRDHLIKQNAQALSHIGSCRYRGVEGRTCAVGCLIKDEFYRALEQEGKGVHTSDVKLALHQSGIYFNSGDQTETMLRAWQEYHDDKFGCWLKIPNEFPSPQSTHERLMEAFGI